MNIDSWLWFEEARYIEPFLRAWLSSLSSTQNVMVPHQIEDSSYPRRALTPDNGKVQDRHVKS